MPAFSRMSREESEELERAVLEGTVKAYDAGLQIDMRGVAIPELDMELLKNRDVAFLKPLLEALSKYNMPMYDLDIRFVPNEERALHGPGLIEFEQFIEGQDVGRIDISFDAGAPSYVSGLLINPDIPQLDSKNWMSTDDAIQMATDVLMRDVKTDGASDRFLGQVREGKLEGKVHIDVHTFDGGVAVNPIYEVVGGKAVVKINLYNGSMETFESSPIY